MPSATVHLKIAYMAKDAFGIKNDTQFYMGCIAPDAVNLRGQASEKERYAVHVRSKNYDEWKENIKAFYYEQKDSFNGDTDYLKGYVFHLLTDIAWDEVVQPNLFAFLQSKGYDKTQFKEQKWKELFRFNTQLATQDWYSEVKDKLRKAVCYGMLGIPVEQVEQYRDYVVSDYEKDKMLDEKPEFLNKTHLLATSIRTALAFEKFV
ncbi:MAG: hypothetical protein Q4D35_00545 [Ruminococcus sp.]|nr:hypothetical protein [Ruminococcus sp.]